MILLLVSSLYLELLLDKSLRGVFQSSSLVLQDFCLQQFVGPTLRPLAGALVCGIDLTGSPLKTLFIDTGIYHVLVVSGAHLGLFIFCFNFFLLRASERSVIRIGVSAILFFYALVTGLQPPVVRALIQYLMIQSRRESARPSDVLLSYFYCLVFEPSWIHSLSLQLSTVATLAFIFPGSLFRKNGLIYLAILPLLIPMGIRSPLVTIGATLIGPVIELVMLPIFLLVMAFKFLQPSLDHGLPFLLTLLEGFRAILPPPTLIDFPHVQFFGPVYVCLLWLITEQAVARSRRHWHLQKEH